MFGKLRDEDDISICIWCGSMQNIMLWVWWWKQSSIMKYYRYLILISFLFGDIVFEMQNKCQSIILRTKYNICSLCISLLKACSFGHHDIFMTEGIPSNHNLMIDQWHLSLSSIISKWKYGKIIPLFTFRNHFLRWKSFHIFINRSDLICNW